MAIKTSSGLRTHLAVTGSVKAAFDGGQLMFYYGTEPATADAAVAGSLLWTVTVGGDGTGVTFESVAVDTAAVKETTETWQGATTAGTPNYWRLIGSTEKGGSIGGVSTTLARIQGTCGNTAGSDIYLTTPTLTTDTDLDAKVLDAFSISILTN
jgi:hypothetical protein